MSLVFDPDGPESVGRSDSAETPLSVEHPDDLTAPESGTEAPVPAPPVARKSRSRVPLYVALVVVAVLSASGLLVAGYALGEQHALTPGTTADDQALFAPFWEAYHKIVAEYVGQFTPKGLVEGSIKGMFQSLNDPFSSYMTSEEYKASLSGVSGQFEGIGAQMSAQDSTGKACSPIGDSCPLTVVHVIRNSPAQKAGLQEADVVTAVDGTSVKGQTVDATVAKVRGPRGTQVTLSLLRGGKPMDLAITRDVIQTEEVTAGTEAGGTVGYLKISGFGSSVSGDFTSLLKDQLAAGIHRFVIDLRDDPGGFVDAAVSVASQFIPSGPIYWQETSDGRQVATNATPGGSATDPSIRVAVLVNGGSASASEILAGALHDTGRASLIGTKTYGKGTIQQWIQLFERHGWVPALGRQMAHAEQDLDPRRGHHPRHGGPRPRRHARGAGPAACCRPDDPRQQSTDGRDRPRHAGRLAGAVADLGAEAGRRCATRHPSDGARPPSGRRLSRPAGRPVAVAHCRKPPKKGPLRRFERSGKVTGNERR